MIPDERMLRLLVDLEVIVEADWSRAERIYSDAKPTAGEPADLSAVANQGWVRPVWGRVQIAMYLHRRIVAGAPEGSMPAFVALRDRIFARAYQGTDESRTDAELSALIESIEAGQQDPHKIICHTPAWVAARLWERRRAESGTASLRRWVDLWDLLQYPLITPGEAWRPDDAEVFRVAVLSVIESESSLRGWPETRAACVQQQALANSVPTAQVEGRVPQPPATFVDRALWFEDRTIQHCGYEALRSCGDVFGLVGLLLADVAAEDNAPAPHPLAVRLIDLALHRPELFFYLLSHARQHPKLLADLLLHPPTTALACLLIARWQSPSSAWDRSLVQRDDRLGQVEAFADAVAILGEFLQDGRAAAAEAAALVTWFHDRGPGYIDDAADEVMLDTLRRELAGAPKALLNAMVTSLDGPELRRGLGTSEFAAVLDLVSLGALAGEQDPTGIVEAYAQSIRRDDFRVKAHRIGIAGAAALAQLASLTPELHQRFLYPLQITERLTEAAPDENPYTLADGIARSIRAHIRILCRAIVGSADDISPDLVDALVAAVKVGALEHKEKGRIAAFAPRLERHISGPLQDRPLAADLSAVLRVLSAAAQLGLMDVFLQTDEPLILAQLLSLSPPNLRDRINHRLSALAPDDAGAIYSLPEIQARIDELLTAGAADAAARYMEAERQLETFGPVPGRDSVRFNNKLRLQYLRNEWAAILSTPRPAFKELQGQTSAEQTLLLFQGIAMLKGPTPDATAAKQIFADLFARQASVACATNWFAAALSQLLSVDSFTLLKGADIQAGRQALNELERMLALTPAGTQLDDEVIDCNKAVLLLALGEPSQDLGGRHGCLTCSAAGNCRHVSCRRSGQAR